MAKQSIKDFYVQCECGSEHVFLTPQDPECLEEGLYMSVLAKQFDAYSFWNRFRHIWYTLIHGLPYVDQVCLDFEKAKQLNKYLDNYINLTELTLKHKKTKRNK